MRPRKNTDMRCPHCGKEIETQQKRAAESRWSSMTPAERAAEMSRVRKLGVKRSKTKARALRQNNAIGQTRADKPLADK